jgi:hypothetical protein
MDVNELRNSFWEGDPSAREKRKKIRVTLRRAKTAFITKLTMKEIDADDYPDHLLFVVGDIEVCETVFVNALGMETPSGYKSKTWTSEVDYWLGMLIDFYYNIFFF